MRANLILLLLFVGGCRNPYLQPLPSNSYRIQNGVIRDVGVLPPIPPGCTLVLPTGTAVVTDPSLAAPTIQIDKELNMYAHPAERISIVSKRDDMGVVVWQDASEMTVETLAVRW